MFCGPATGMVSRQEQVQQESNKTKKKAEKVLDEIAEQIGCCKADEIIYAGRGIGGLRVTVYQALAQEYVYQMPAEEEEEDADQKTGQESNLQY